MLKRALLTAAFAALVATPIALLFGTGCGTPPQDGDQVEETRPEALRCDPCDPDELSEAIIQEASALAESLYSQAVAREASCVDLDPGLDCNIMFSTPDSWCGPITIDCHSTSAAGSRIRCTDLGSAGGCD
jgi:hypothetical protein